MTSTVMTGRRTKSSDRFMLENLRLDFDFRSGTEAQLPLCDHPLAFFQTARDDGVVALGARDRDFAQFGGHVGLDHEDVLATGPGLHRSGWYDQGVLLVVERDPYIDELAWPQRVFAVPELRAQLDRAGARIDRVVDEDQRSGGRGFIRARRQRLDPERTRGHVAADGHQLLLRHGEVHVDGVDLVDHDQGKCIAGSDQVSHLDLDFSRIAFDRRADRAVLNVQLRVVERGAAPLSHGSSRIGVGADLRVGFLGHEILVQQVLVAALLRAGLVLLRRVAQEIGLGLAQDRLIGARVDIEEHATPRDCFAFLETYFDDLSVDARLDGHGGKGFDVADGQQPEWHDLLQDRGNRDGNRRRSLGRLALVRAYLGAEISEQHDRDDEQTDAAENEQALGRRYRNVRSQ